MRDTFGKEEDVKVNCIKIKYRFMNKNYGFSFLSKFVKIKLNSKVGKHFPTCFLGKMLK